MGTGCTQKTIFPVKRRGKLVTTPSARPSSERLLRVQGPAWTKLSRSHPAPPSAVRTRAGRLVCVLACSSHPHGCISSSHDTLWISARPPDARLIRPLQQLRRLQGGAHTTDWEGMAPGVRPSRAVQRDPQPPPPMPGAFPVRTAQTSGRCPVSLGADAQGETLAPLSPKATSAQQVPCDPRTSCPWYSRFHWVCEIDPSMGLPAKANLLEPVQL